MSSLATRIAAVVDALFPRKKRNVVVVKTKRFAHASLKEKQKNDWQKREAERKDTTSSPEFSSLSLRREQRQREETKMIATSSRSSSAVSTNTSRSSSKFVTSKKTSNTLRGTRNRHNNSNVCSSSMSSSEEQLLESESISDMPPLELDDVGTVSYTHLTLPTKLEV